MHTRASPACSAWSTPRADSATPAERPPAHPPPQTLPPHHTHPCMPRRRRHATHRDAEGHGLKLALELEELGDGMPIPHQRLCHHPHGVLFAKRRDLCCVGRGRWEEMASCAAMHWSFIPGRKNVGAHPCHNIIIQETKPSAPPEQRPAGEQLPDVTPRQPRPCHPAAPPHHLALFGHLLDLHDQLLFLILQSSALPVKLPDRPVQKTLVLAQELCRGQGGWAGGRSSRHVRAPPVQRGEPKTTSNWRSPAAVLRLPNIHILTEACGLRGRAPLP